MSATIPIVPQLEEQNVLDFERSEVAVSFFLDICSADVDTLKQYYQIALKNVVFLRTQNNMKVRYNDRYLNLLEQEIARLENRWVIPFSKATNIFQSATKFTDVPPKDVSVKGSQNEAANDLEVTPVKKTGIQIKTRWIDEPAVTQLKAIGVKPYKEVMKRLRILRHKRSQYKYLELYFVSLGRQILNLQMNLRLVLALIDFLTKVRQKYGDAKLANNPVGEIVKAIIANNDLETAIQKLGQLQIDQMLGAKGGGGPAGNEKAQSTSSTTAATGQQNTTQTVSDNATGVNPVTGGDIPAQPLNPASVGPTGINPNQGQIA